MLDITPVVESLFALLASILTAVIVPYLKTKIDDYWIKTAVDAAEQVYKGSKRGPERKAKVLEWLKRRKLLVNESKLDIMIEAAVGKIKKEINGQSDGQTDEESDDDASGS